ncbi:MAG: hypothetical protein GY725_26080 [bacterium]|nr:hypothetical protein [bacterium]
MHVITLSSLLTLMVSVPITSYAQSDDLGRTALMYLPNRLLDVFRANVKLGQGIAGGVRATKDVEAFMGTYTAAYVGLRGGPEVRWPIGLEDRTHNKPGTKSGSWQGLDPKYGRGEIGIDLFPFVGGAAVGVDVYEIGDLLGGFIGFDPAKDDR